MAKDITVAHEEFRVPAELLKSFQKEVRFIPNHLPVAGYIIFDHEMLKSILLNKDPEVRAKFAQQIDSLEKAGGELVIVNRAQTGISR